MKKISILTVFLLIFTSQSAIAENMQFEGVGAWRLSNHSEGQYTNYSNVSWKQCYDFCIASSNCKGVEYGLHMNGVTSCEVHTKELGYVRSINSNKSIGLVWIKK